MKKFIKPLTLIMSVIMLLCFFSGCSSIPASYATAVKDDVSYDLDTKLYIYSAYWMHLNLEYYAASYGMAVSDMLAAQEGSSMDYVALYNDNIKDQALALFISGQKFSEMGLAISEDDIATVNENYESMSTSLGEATLRKLRAKLKLSETAFKEFLVELYKQDLVFEKLLSKGGEKEITDDELNKFFTENYYHVRHILIKFPTTQDGTTISSTKDQSDANIKLYNDAKAKADSILSKAQAGEDFIALAKDNTEDSVSETEGFTYNENGFLVEPYGYIFKDGQMDQAFFDKAKEMAVGAIDIVETSYGWHIMQKFDVTKAEKAFDLLKNDINSTISSNKRTEILDAWRKEYTVEYNESVLKKYSIDKLSNLMS